MYKRSMEGPTHTCHAPEPHPLLTCLDERQPTPFSQQWVTITKQERIEFSWRASYWEAQHDRVKTQMEALKEENLLKDAKIKDLQNRLFGKTSEATIRETSRWERPSCLIGP